MFAILALNRDRVLSVLYHTSMPFAIIGACIVLHPFVALALLLLIIISAIRGAQYHGKSITFALLRSAVLLCSAALVGYPLMVFGTFMLGPFFVYGPNLVFQRIEGLGIGAFPWITAGLWIVFAIRVVRQSQLPSSVRTGASEWDRTSYTKLGDCHGAVVWRSLAVAALGWFGKINKVHRREDQRDSTNRTVAICLSIAIGAASVETMIYLTVLNTRFAMLALLFLFAIPPVAGLLQGLLLRESHRVAYFIVGILMAILGDSAAFFSFVLSHGGPRATPVERLDKLMDPVWPTISVFLAAWFGNWVRNLR
jgi:hypothetical protein